MFIYVCVMMYNDVYYYIAMIMSNGVLYNVLR